MNENRVIGVVLAGGASRRMGGQPKALMAFGSGTLLTTAVAALRRQVRTVLVNSNDDDPAYAKDADDVVADAFRDRRGPLAGVLAAMEWAEVNRPDCLCVASVAVDTPLFPVDTVERLCAAREPSGIALARVDGRPQPTFGVWPIELAADLRSFLSTSESLKVLAFTGRHSTTFVDFDDAKAFENANTPEELAALRERAER